MQDHWTPLLWIFRLSFERSKEKQTPQASIQVSKEVCITSSQVWILMRQEIQQESNINTSLDRAWISLVESAAPDDE